MERTDRPQAAMSVVIPVLNERDTIVPCIAGVRAVDGGDECEVIVVDGDPGGSTLDAIVDADVVCLIAEKGRSRQMNAGARHACGDVVVFLHADTRLPSTAIRDISALLDDPAVVGGAFAHCFDSQRLVHRIVSMLVSVITRWNRLPYGDQAIFIRREYFERIGGFSPIDIMEDHELVRRIRRRGDTLRLLDTPARTSCRRLDDEGIVRRIVKNWAMTVAYAVGVSPRHLARYYRARGEPEES